MFLKEIQMGYKFKEKCPFSIADQNDLETPPHPVRGLSIKESNKQSREVVLQRGPARWAVPQWAVPWWAVPGAVGCASTANSTGAPPAKSRASVGLACPGRRPRSVQCWCSGATQLNPSPAQGSAGLNGQVLRTSRTLAWETAERPNARAIGHGPHRTSCDLQTGRCRVKVTVRLNKPLRTGSSHGRCGRTVSGAFRWGTQ